MTVERGARDRHATRVLQSKALLFRFGYGVRGHMAETQNRAAEGGVPRGQPTHNIGDVGQTRLGV